MGVYINKESCAFSNPVTGFSFPPSVTPWTHHRPLVGPLADVWRFIPVPVSNAFSPWSHLPFPQNPGWYFPILGACTKSATVKSHWICSVLSCHSGEALSPATNPDPARETSVRCASQRSNRGDSTAVKVPRREALKPE